MSSMWSGMDKLLGIEQWILTLLQVMRIGGRLSIEMTIFGRWVGVIENAFECYGNVYTNKYKGRGLGTKRLRMLWKYLYQ